MNQISICFPSSTFVPLFPTLFQVSENEEFLMLPKAHSSVPFVSLVPSPNSIISRSDLINKLIINVRYKIQWSEYSKCPMSVTLIVPL